LESRGQDCPAGDDPALAATTATLFASALAALALREREAVVLRIQYDLSVEDTASIMRVSPGTGKGYTADGLRRLEVLISL